MKTHETMLKLNVKQNTKSNSNTMKQNKLSSMMCMCS